MQFPINKYDTVITDRYNGKYQIKVGAMWNDGQFHQDFKQIKKKDGSTKAIPVTLTFDDDSDVLQFCDLIKAEIRQTKESQTTIDDVPF